MLNNSYKKFFFFFLQQNHNVYLACKVRVVSFYFSNLSLLIFTIHLYQCISIRECPYQLKTINKRVIISFILLILDNDFSMSNYFQVWRLAVAILKASFLLSIKTTVQNVLFSVLTILHCNISMLYYISRHAAYKFFWDLNKRGEVNLDSAREGYKFFPARLG